MYQGIGFFGQWVLRWEGASGGPMVVTSLINQLLIGAPTHNHVFASVSYAIIKLELHRVETETVSILPCTGLKCAGR